MSVLYSVCFVDVSVCTCRTGAIRRGAPEALRGAFGRVPRPGACTRVARRGVSDPVRIRSCAMPAGHPVWIARAPTTLDRVASTHTTKLNFFFFFIELKNIKGY